MFLSVEKEPQWETKFPNRQTEVIIWKFSQELSSVSVFTIYSYSNNIVWLRYQTYRPAFIPKTRHIVISLLPNTLAIRLFLFFTPLGPLMLSPLFFLSFMQVLSPPLSPLAKYNSYPS